MPNHYAYELSSLNKQKQQKKSMHTNTEAAKDK